MRKYGKDHESRLLPYVVSALNDEAELVQKEAVELMEALGVQYEKEHEKDLKVAPGGCCLPRHPTHVEPSSLEVNGIL